MDQLLVDKTHQMFQHYVNNYFVDPINDGYIVILAEQVAGSHPFDGFEHKIKKLDPSGNVIIEKTLWSYDYNTTPNCFKSGGNYRVEHFVNTNDTSQAFIESYLYNVDLELLAVDSIPVTLCAKCTTSPTYGVSFSSGDSTLRLMKYNVRIQTDTGYTYLYDEEMGTLYDRNGYFLKINHVTSGLPYGDAVEYNRPIPIGSSGKVFVPGANLTVFEQDFNLHSRVENPWYFPADITQNIQYAPYHDGIVMINFGSDLADTSHYFHIKTLDESFHLIQEWNIPLGRHAIHPLINNFSPQGGLFIDHEGNYNYYAVSNGYVDNIELNTSEIPGNLIFLKLDPSLEVLCFKIYNIPRQQLHLYQVSHLDNGLTLLSGSMDTIVASNGHKNFHPFIGILHDGCDISWAEDVYNTLTSQEVLSINHSPFIYPNPVKDAFRLAHSEAWTEVNIQIIDAFGRFVQKNKLHSNDLMDVNQLQPGAYFYKISDAQGRLLTQGKFVKM